MNIKHALIINAFLNLIETIAILISTLWKKYLWTSLRK
ncbi:hypothetical protein M917_1162 [Psychrobacter aquaticus CMS 56]|uniref:Uncharacterized protein n=1 Tax=Psychrobacter aquaticus CMS 56 TaxID=1354303 RepID=U4TBQ7_9GAMM|nr:hypothetical protein M917_1162 [Psychrobacter aquaticus CMS 56]